MRKAFTLIELLIVIAIIAILALIAIPNFLEAQTRAKVARSQADMRTVATAIEAYFVDYGLYPICPQNSIDDANVNSLFARGSSGWEGYHSVYWMDVPEFKSLIAPISYMTCTRRTLEDPFISRHDVRVNYTPECYELVNIDGASRWLMATKGAGPMWKSGSTNNPNPVWSSPMPFRFNGPQGTVYQAAWALCGAGPNRTRYENKNNGSTGNIRPEHIVQDSAGWNANYVTGTTDLYDPSNGTVSAGNLWRFSSGAPK